MGSGGNIFTDLYLHQIMNEPGEELVGHTSSNTTQHVFKGAFFYLSPITIPLSIVVILHNVVIFISYYPERRKLNSSLFMGIAVADILRAQGEVVMSLISIFVYTGWFYCQGELVMSLISIFVYTGRFYCR